MKKWDILKRKEVYKNKYFSVVEEEFRLSDGKTSKYYLVKSCDFVSVVPVEGEHIYMEKMDRYTLRRRIIEIPMGGIEEGETPLAAAKRELKEEMGITAKRFRKLGFFDASKGHSGHKGVLFVAEELTLGEPEPDLVEKESNIEVIKLKLRDVPDLIRQGKITDSHTIASFYLYMLHCKSPNKQV